MENAYKYFNENPKKTHNNWILNNTEFEMARIVQ